MAPNTKTSGLRMKVEGEWINVSDDIILKHPGGAVIKQYKNADASHMFNAFHEGSDIAFKQLEVLKRTSKVTDTGDLEAALKKRVDKPDVNISTYDISVEEEKKIVKNFEKLKQEITDEGLMEAQLTYFFFKSVSTVGILFLAFYLQYLQWYITSAFVQALAWQQFGWLTHEYCHHQPTKNRKLNNILAVVFGNLCQGFSSDWWKDKHNTHHAATNIIDHDGDIDLSPLFSFIPQDLLKYKGDVERVLLKIIPYQHLYFTLSLPLLRVSWTTQSIQWVINETNMDYKVYNKNALYEQTMLALHWSWVIFQLYMLPTFGLRVAFFLISQLLSGLLIGGVVTFNHNSVDKYPADSRLLNNFCCLQILTTRNMSPSPFVDWLWGGLNYQIEHHLFPTMPRCNLNRCSTLVKQFCKENKLPYMVDNYMDGYRLNLKQLENIAELAAKTKSL